MNPFAIEFQDVQKSFELNFTLGPLSLRVPRGSIYGLIGPNGAGKSTALNMLMGLGEPGFGNIRVLDRDLPADEVDIKRRTAFVSPDMDFRAWGTVGRVIDFVRGFYPDWNAGRCEELQFAFGVHRDARVDALSFGSRMKLALILALSRDAELLVLDEPTLGLDAVARRQLFAELLRFMSADGRTILISSHQLTDLERFADHVAVVNKGKLLTSGRMDRMIERYRQVDARILSDARIAAAGVQVLDQSGDRVKILVDQDAAAADALAQVHVEVLAEVPLSLEELFLALIKSADMRSGWWPQMSAA
ncbi:MAG TPA: ABC transporter ATP-binding protein [Steroidobacteraceae bacterium]|jgi:ABC-2 type transport system ATP-binding protein|nr:ABC transporter ATP-binding protein [Steroidobacteraceae bacterium]